MATTEEWHKELHWRTFDFRTGRRGGDEYYRMFSETPAFDFWLMQLNSSSTWTTKKREYVAVDELDDDHLLNIWSYMVREQEFMSLVWVRNELDPAEAHLNLSEDWLTSTPIMEALAWEMEARGMERELPLPLDYSDLEKQDYWS